jgi:hypothetical protein
MRNSCYVTNQQGNTLSYFKKRIKRIWEIPKPRVIDKPSRENHRVLGKHEKGQNKTKITQQKQDSGLRPPSCTPRAGPPALHATSLLLGFLKNCAHYSLSYEYPIEACRYALES